MDNRIAEIENLLSDNALLEAKKLLDLLLKEEATPSLYIHYLIAIYHIRSGIYNLAVPHLVNIEASDSNPHFLPQVYKLLAYCALMQGEYHQGERILREFSDAFYSDIDVKNMLAFACYSQENVEEATRLYQAVLSEDNGNLTARNGMACILIDYQENFEEAIRVLESWGEKSEDPRILDTLGWAYLRMGDIKKSKLYLRKAFDLLPAHPEINRHMALLMRQL